MIHKILVLSLVLLSNALATTEDTFSEASWIPRMESELQRFLQWKKTVDHLHPVLAQHHPIALIANNHFYVFDYRSTDQSYRFILKQPTPIPIPAGVRASFALDFYEFKPSCVVDESIFSSTEEYVILLHEFVHCAQFKDCEMDLKETLHIARIAAENEDFSWELNYDFPYDDERFIHRYQQLISDLENRELANLDAIRLELKTQLSEQDFEYMIWQEWKERFARFLENRIRQVTGLDPNHSGRNLPFDRIIFYHGGSLFIEHLIDSDPELAFEQRALFQRIRMGQK